MIENGLHVGRLAVGCEPHHLVLAGIDLEAGVVGERGIEQPERVREMDFLRHLELVAASNRGRGRGPFADAVHRQHGGFLERRRKKSGSGVALMVLAKQEPVFPIEVGRECLELVAQELLLEQLLL